MDEKKIVQGGVYRVDSGHIPKKVKLATVCDILEHSMYCRLDTLHMIYIKPNELGEQVGYDAEFSREYGDTYQELIKLQALKHSASDLNAYYAAHYGDGLNLPPMLRNCFAKFKRDIDADIGRVQQQLKDIKSKSWGETNEPPF